MHEHDAVHELRGPGREGEGLWFRLRFGLGCVLVLFVWGCRKIVTWRPDALQASMIWFSSSKLAQGHVIKNV